MDDRTRMFWCCAVLAIVILLSSCGYNQHSRFQTSFLPPAPNPGVGSSADEIVPAVVVPPNPYLEHLPAVFLSPRPPMARLAVDKVQKAEQAYAKGRQLYAVSDITGARREFDRAIDLLLDASDDSPDNREDFARRLDEMVDTIHKLDLADLGASASIDPGRFEKAPLEDILEMTFPVDPKLKNVVRQQIAASVSQLPLTVNDAVLGYIHYFSNRGRKTMVAATQRSGRYRSMIQRILDEEGLPPELIHLAQAESGFIPRALSRKAAGGMWQFLMWRGRQYGLMQTRYTDDRMDPEKATRAAARHLRDLYSEFGDWYLAIAAYNCGPGTIEKAVERTGYADFFELRNRRVIPLETTNYVPIILAMTIMEKNAAAYGLDDIELDPPVEYDTVEVDAPTSLTLVADITGAPLADVAAMNPAALKGIIPEDYGLHVPKGSGEGLQATLSLIPKDRRISWRVHRVGEGETLAQIGKRYGATVAAIVSANRLRSAEASEGDRLVIPAASGTKSPSRRTASSKSATSKTPARKPVVTAKIASKAPVTVARASN